MTHRRKSSHYFHCTRYTSNHRTENSHRRQWVTAFTSTKISTSSKFSHRIASHRNTFHEHFHSSNRIHNAVSHHQVYIEKSGLVFLIFAVSGKIRTPFASTIYISLHEYFCSLILRYFNGSITGKKQQRFRRRRFDAVWWTHKHTSPIARRFLWTSKEKFSQFS